MVRTSTDNINELYAVVVTEGWFSHPQHNQVRDDKLCRNKVGCARDSCGDLDVGPVASLLPVP